MYVHVQWLFVHIAKKREGERQPWASLCVGVYTLAHDVSLLILLMEAWVCLFTSW